MTVKDKSLLVSWTLIDIFNIMKYEITISKYRCILLLGDNDIDISLCIGSVRSLRPNKQYSGNRVMVLAGQR